jgi:flagellar biosynthesis anti-sigma factor FlgM
MKIDLNTLAASQLSVDRGAKQVSNSSLTGAQATTQDRTTLHSDSLSVQALTSQAMNTPPIRQDTVAALRQSVTSGTYQPDASKTADAMIENNRQ